jgi:DNA-binding PucR family transcriptional regulator
VRVKGRWIASLSIGDDDLVKPVLPSDTVTDAIDTIGTGAVNWSIKKACKLAEMIIERYPAFGGGPSQFDTLRIATESTVLTCLAEIFEGKLVHWKLTPEAAFHIRDLVHRRVSQADNLAAIRFTHVTLCDWLMEACRSFVPPEELADQLHLISRSLLFFFDTLSDDVTQTYQAEHKRYSESPIAYRDETLRLVLESDPEDIAIASGRLRYELIGRYHVAIILTRREPRHVDDSLHLTARKILQSYHVDQILLVPDGRSALWGWGNSRSPIPERVELEKNPGISAVVGPPSKGLAGFRQTHKQALAAQRIVEFLQEDSDVTHYFSDLHLLTLLGPDHQKIDNFVRCELRDLADAGAAMTELRATLGIYLDNHSPQATANRMHIARNTVAYRLRRIEELLHHPISERQTEMRVALLLKDSVAFST